VVSELDLKLAKNPRNAEQRWWALVNPWMSSVRASSRDRWCYHVRRVLPMHWSRESWLVERGESYGWIIVWGEARWSFVRGEDCWVYEQSPTLIRSGKDHEYIRMEKYLHWYEAFWGKAQKQIHEGLGPKWTISYHCGDMLSPDSLHWESVCKITKVCVKLFNDSLGAFHNFKIYLLSSLRS